MKTKKILILHHCGLIGGAGISLLNMWEDLKNEYDVSVYMPYVENGLFDMAKNKGLIPKTYNFYTGSFSYYNGGNSPYSLKLWIKFLLTFFAGKRISTIIQKENPDLVIINSKTGAWMSRILKKLNVKSICYVRETIPQNRCKCVDKLMKRSLEEFSAVAFISDYDCEIEKLENTMTFTVPNYINTSTFLNNLTKKQACNILGLDCSKFNVLYVGGISYLKGYDVAINAIGVIGREDISLVVAGNINSEVEGLSIFKKVINRLTHKSIYRYYNYCDKLLKRLDINDKIFHIGMQKDISIAYSACDLLIFPMQVAHQARPAFEIGAQKKPVIISDFPNIREYVRDNINGLTFKSGDYKSLAENIIKLRNDDNLRNKLGYNNYEYVIKNHTRENSSTILLSNIRKILG